MSLNIIHFFWRGRTQWGVIRDGHITPVPGEFPSTADFIRENPIDMLRLLDDPQVHERDVALLSPITHNQQFVCQGANYRRHMIESGMNPGTKTFNMIFTKASSCIVPSNSHVVRPKHVKFLDYEIELGLVLKRDIRQFVKVTDKDLHEYIAGIVIVNDYSARDVQIPQMQFYKGKSYRTFGPVGPYLCLLDPSDIAQLAQLQLTLTVNDQVRQHDTTRHLVYGPAETLTELSGVHDLAVGDLLATGTPAGCALSVPSPTKQRAVSLLPEQTKWALFLKIQAKRIQYLKPGDVVESRIRSFDGRIHLGAQRNLIVEEQ
jgi:2-keto-4-pentenoate hydratase/2-oxohepta-3-ene-1,7-dioic acid hydratase in catechol pathway